MYKKVLRITGIAAGIVLVILFSAVFWVYLNQEKVINRVKEAVNSSISGELEIGGFEFEPFGRTFGLTFSLSDISLRDSLHSKGNNELLAIRKLDVTFGWQTLLMMKINVRNIHLQDGSIFIFHRRDGYSNLTVFGEKKQKKEGSSSILGKIKGISLDNVAFTFADSLKEKYYEATLHRVSGRFKPNPKGWEAQLRGPIHMGRLMFNSEKGAFLKNTDIHLTALLQYDKSHQLIKFDQGTTVQLAGGEVINMSGAISTAGPGNPIVLHFRTNRIRVPVATKVLADTIASKIDRIGIDTYVSAEVLVNAETGQKKAGVMVNFKTDTFSYQTPYGKFRELKTDGYFNNQFDTTQLTSAENCFLKTGTIRGYFEEVPIKASLSVLNFVDPVAETIIHASADARSLNSLLDIDRYKATSGFVNVDLKYTGKLSDIYVPETDQLAGKLFGRVAIVGLEVSYLPRRINLSKVESVISFNTDEVLVQRLALSDGLNRMFIHGKLTRPFHAIFGSPKPAVATIDIDIPSWKFNWIEVLVGQSQQQKKNGSPKLSTLADNLLGNLQVDATLKAGDLTYHSLKARNVRAKLLMSGNTTEVRQLNLDAFGGKVDLKGSLISPDVKHQVATFNAVGKISHADASSILRSFNDFGQKALSSKNVNGKLDLDFHLSSLVNPDVSLVPHSMNGKLNVNFRDGQLINFEPFLKIKKIIFKNRPLENVKIAPIKKSFRLKGQEVLIEKMQIETNVVTLFLEGQYSFGDKTDLSIQFPLQNLKRRDENYEFQTYDSEGMRSIFLRAVDEDGEVNIKLDSRRKARRRNYADSTAADSTDRQ